MALPLVIVGASYAGTHLAAEARALGFDAPIIMLGDEPHLPYQRPPLSKGLLTGKTTVDSLALKGPGFYSDNDIEVLLSRRATALDVSAQTLSLDDGRVLNYGWLALATGARCRPLPVPGTELGGVFNLRTLDDALSISDALSEARRACVIGGGFIGLEVASALASRGKAVTVVEGQSRLLARSFPPPMSEYLAQAHRSRGVEILLNSSVTALRGEQGKVRAVDLSDGTSIPCDIVILGIGVQPNVELAQQAGIACDNGILVDALGRTSAERVLAIGDVANMEWLHLGGGTARMRLESIQAANDSARAAASAIVGNPQPLARVPWFWSDQHTLKLQMAGLPMEADRPVIRGDMQADRFSLFYLRDGALAAAHSVNRPAEHMLSRKLIAASARFTAQELQDESFDLKCRLAG